MQAGILWHRPIGRVNVSQSELSTIIISYRRNINNKNADDGMTLCSYWRSHCSLSAKWRRCHNNRPTSFNKVWLDL